MARQWLVLAPYNENGGLCTRIDDEEVASIDSLTIFTSGDGDPQSGDLRSALVGRLGEMEQQELVLVPMDDAYTVTVHLRLCVDVVSRGGLPKLIRRVP